MPSKRKWWAEALRKQRAFEAWLERRELVLAKRIGASRNRMIRGIASQYPLSPDSEFRLLQVTHRDEVEALLIAMAEKIIPSRASLTLDDIQQFKRWPQYNGYFARLVQMWVALNATDEANTIAQTAITDVRKAIDKGVKQGLGVNAIARDIRKVAALTPYRARTIARTETHNASLFATESIAKQAENDFGLRLEKYWIPTLDARTRDAHAMMAQADGQPMDGMFTVGGVKMSRPGDPRGGAANVVNCRCGLVIREKEYEIE